MSKCGCGFNYIGGKCPSCELMRMMLLAQARELKKEIEEKEK